MGEDEADRKYRFHWDLIGDIALGRPNLGNRTRLEVFRLMQFCFRDVLERHMGAERTDQIAYEAGELAGRHFYAHLVGDLPDLSTFIDRLRDRFREMGIGILRVEELDIPAIRQSLDRFPEVIEALRELLADLPPDGIPESVG